MIVGPIQPKLHEQDSQKLNNNPAKFQLKTPKEWRAALPLYEGGTAALQI